MICVFSVPQNNMDGVTTKFVTYPEVSDYHLHVAVHVIQLFQEIPMFVEDLLCKQEDSKTVILQVSDPHNQYNKVCSNPLLTI